jgi:hypothetical protein
MLTYAFVCFGTVAVLSLLMLTRLDVPAIRLPEADRPEQGVSITRFPLQFEPNVGQAPAGAEFIARRGREVFQIAPSWLAAPSFRQRLVGANSSATGRGLAASSSVSNYLIGNDPTQWRTDVPNYRGVRYVDVYPSVDLIYSGQESSLAYQFVVRPGGNPADVRFALDGVDSVSAAAGRLTAAIGDRTLVWDALQAFQVIDGKEVPVSASFRQDGDAGYAFAVGAYDPSKPLVIDPTLVLDYSTYFGGSGTEDSALGIALDASDYVYLAGRTTSANFPTAGAFQPASAGGQDGYLVKLSPDATAIVFSTYFGGSGSDQANNVAVDGSGNVYAAGTTDSTNFPTANAYQAARAGSRDFFLAKFDAAGSTLAFSTYLGGTGTENFASDMKLDGSGNAYLSGVTASTNYPTVSPYQAAHAGGTSDVVVSKFSSAGSLTYSTYLGGSLSDGTGTNLAVDGAGNMYVSGSTSSVNFPTTAGAYQTSLVGGTDDFLTKIDAAGATLSFSTYFGGSGNDSPVGAAGTPVVAPDGSVYISGFTESTNLPVTADAFQPVHAADGAGGRDTFVSRFSSDGTALLYSTYFGGNAGDNASRGMALEGGRLTLAFQTVSTDLPVQDAVQASFGGGAADAYVARFQPGQSDLTFGTYLGGTGSDIPFGLAISNDHGVVVVGTTGSANFPTTAGVVQPSPSTLSDAFITKILSPQAGAGPQYAAPQISLAKSAEPSSLPDGPGDVTYAYAVTNPGFPTLNDVSVSDDRCAPLVFVGGDYNGDGKLQSYDEWHYACAAHLNETTTNAATAVGYANSQQATATAVLTVEVAPAPAMPGESYDPEAERASSPTIDADKDLASASGVCVPGSLIKSRFLQSVFYCARDGRRYVFPNEKTYFTWFPDFTGVKTVSDSFLAQIPIGGNVTYRPGVRMLKLQSDPRVYAVSHGGVLRWVETEAVARALYGDAWNRMIDDLPEVFFADYRIGTPIGEEEVAG